MRNIYLIGSLRNPSIPKIATKLRDAGHYVFDDWFAAGELADDAWRDYEVARGHNLTREVTVYAANHVLELDQYHLGIADTGILIFTTGKGGHLELGYLIGTGCYSYIVYPEEPERFDVMYLLADGVFSSLEELISRL